MDYPSSRVRVLRGALPIPAGAVVLRDGGVPGSGYFDLRLAAGERGKSWRELERVLRWLCERRIERSSPLVVVGGGAALDLGAMAAALYRRGMPLIFVPTTLLAMVDASLGGKAAIDGPGRIKNFAGTFYPAREVWIRLEFLRSLPRRERLSGAAELWKTLWIDGGKFSSAPILDFVETGGLRGLEPLLRRSLRIKQRIVERDPLDLRRVREVLNFGHSIGHALEAQSRLSHGECVLWGMALELKLLGREAEELRHKILALIRSLELRTPAALNRPDLSRWTELLRADKKIRAGKIELSLPCSPGRITRLRMPPEGLLRVLEDPLR